MRSSQAQQNKCYAENKFPLHWRNSLLPFYHGNLKLINYKFI